MRDHVYGNEILDKFDHFDTANATTWIDPLDGTREFTRGSLSDVTVLIGLALDGLPKLGVVHNPYQTKSPDSKGMTLFGS